MQKLGFIPTSSSSLAQTRKKEFLRPQLETESIIMPEINNKNKKNNNKFPILEFVDEKPESKPQTEIIGDEKQVREQLKRDLSNLIFKR
jgi:hypothetical protein